MENKRIFLEPTGSGAFGDLSKLGDHGAISKALKRIIASSGDNLRWYLDLIQVGDDKVSFTETKAEGDQLRRHQLAQIIALRG